MKLMWFINLESLNDRWGNFNQCNIKLSQTLRQQHITTLSNIEHWPLNTKVFWNPGVFPSETAFIIRRCHLFLWRGMMQHSKIFWKTDTRQIDCLLRTIWFAFLNQYCIPSRISRSKMWHIVIYQRGTYTMFRKTHNSNYIQYSCIRPLRFMPLKITT